MNKKYINNFFLKFKQQQLESKYQNHRQKQLQIPYSCNLLSLLLLSIVIILTYKEQSIYISWLYISIITLIILIFIWLVLYHNKYFLYYHFFWNISLATIQLGMNYLYIENKTQNIDIFSFIIIQEAIFIIKAFSIDSSNFLLDILIIGTNRIIPYIIFKELKQNFTNASHVLFVIMPLFLIF